MTRLLGSKSRAGFSLTEVLISLLILMIGVTSVIALFPAGIHHIQQAVLDTRCTLVARSMWDVVDLHGMGDDPLHRDPSPPALANFLQSAYEFNYSGVSATGEPDSYYLNIVPANVDSLAETDTASEVSLNAAPGTSGLPLLVDPLWIETLWSTQIINEPTYDNRRQTAVAFPASGGTLLAPFNTIHMNNETGTSLLDGTDTPGWPHPMRVVTTWEAASIAYNLGPPEVLFRTGYVRRWFTSPGDIKYRERVAGIPESPSSNGAVLNDPGTTVFPLSLADSTAARDYPYSWAYIIQRPVTAGPNIDTAATAIPEAILVFSKRNFNAYPHPDQTTFPGGRVPYVCAVAAFLDGDSRVTLRYATGFKPVIRRGSWLCEMTIQGPDADHRRSFNFHRVADYEDAVDGTTPIIKITLDRVVSGYPATLTNATATRTYPDPAPAPELKYYPVVIFDGLQEVYSRNGNW